MAKIRIRKESEAPGTPPEGYVYLYVDENDGLLKQVGDDGSTHTVTNPQTFTDELKAKLDSVEWGANAYSIINDLVNDLTTGGTDKALTAEQGKVLKQAIDNINEILNSDDTDLDTLQEIVDFIKQNKDELENLTIDNIAGLRDALDNKADKVHTHSHTDITDFDEAVSNNEDVSANTDARHTHNNKALLDSLTSSGQGDKFLANDGEYHYVTVCGEAESIVFPTSQQSLLNESGKIKLFYDGHGLNYVNDRIKVSLEKITPYVSGINRNRIPLNSNITVSVLGGNFDNNTIVTIDDHGQNIVTMNSYEVVSYNEIQLNLQTYGLTGTFSVYLRNGNETHFGYPIEIEIVRKLELDDVLNNFISNSATISGMIENQYNFSGGDSSRYISDGGGDMYDGGNKIYTNLGGGLYYTNGAIRQETRLGPNGKYFTKKQNYVFFAAFDLDGISWIKIDGNLGADGRGSYHHGTFAYNGFRVYWKTVGGTGDPSINHIWILEDNLYTSQVIGTTTDSDLDKIINLDQGDIDRIYYTLYAKSSGEQSPIEEIQSIAQYLIDNII